MKADNKKRKEEMIEYAGKHYSIRELLDSEESYQKYLNGSDNFKKALELGLMMQIAQLNNLLRK